MTGATISGSSTKDCTSHASGEPPVQHQGDREPEHERAGHARDHEAEGVRQHHPKELAVGEDVRIVREADPGALADRAATSRESSCSRRSRIGTTWKKTSASTAGAISASMKRVVSLSVRLHVGRYAVSRGLWPGRCPAELRRGFFRPASSRSQPVGSCRRGRRALSGCLRACRTRPRSTMSEYALCTAGHSAK